MIPPLANSSIASPLTRMDPVVVVGAAAVISSVAWSVVPLVALLCKMSDPLLCRPAAVTVVDALRPPLPLPILVVPELVSVPPTVTVLLALVTKVPTLLMPRVVVSDAPVSAVNSAPESMMIDLTEVVVVRSSLPL